MRRNHLLLATVISFIWVLICAVIASDFVLLLMVFINLLWMWGVVGFYALTNRGKDE